MQGEGGGRQHAQLPAPLQGQMALIEEYVAMNLNKLVSHLTRQLDTKLSAEQLQLVKTACDDFIQSSRPAAAHAAAAKTARSPTQALSQATAATSPPMPPPPQLLPPAPPPVAPLEPPVVQVQVIPPALPHEPQLQFSHPQPQQPLLQQQQQQSRSKKLILRHDCQSSGCGDQECRLCRFNPSRLCQRHLKSKYLIRDTLRAKCNAPLVIEYSDNSKDCTPDAMWAGGHVEVLMLNGEMFKELCPDPTRMTLAQSDLRRCILPDQKALMQRKTPPATAPNSSMPKNSVFLKMEHGRAQLSDVRLMASSEALLGMKEASFCLLIWPVDERWQPIPNAPYYVSDSFAVATQRVKLAIKSDIPLVTEHVSKLEHIGRATVCKLADLRAAGVQGVPDALNCVTNISDFKELVTLCEGNANLLKLVVKGLHLSPAKWEEVCAHASKAVHADFRPRVWWAPNAPAAAAAASGGGAATLPRGCSDTLMTGLIFPCYVGLVNVTAPVALVVRGAAPPQDVVTMLDRDSPLPPAVAAMAKQAVAAWYVATHPNWEVYWRDSQDAAMQAVATVYQASEQLFVANWQQQQALQQQLMGPLPGARPAEPTSPATAATATAAATTAAGPSTAAAIKACGDAFQHYRRVTDHMLQSPEQQQQQAEPASPDSHAFRHSSASLAAASEVPARRALLSAVGGPPPRQHSTATLPLFDQSDPAVTAAAIAALLIQSSRAQGGQQLQQQGLQHHHQQQAAGGGLLQWADVQQVLQSGVLQQHQQHQLLQQYLQQQQQQQVQHFQQHPHQSQQLPLPPHDFEQALWASSEHLRQQHGLLLHHAVQQRQQQQEASQLIAHQQLQQQHLQQQQQQSRPAMPSDQHPLGLLGGLSGKAVPFHPAEQQQYLHAMRSVNSSSLNFSSLPFANYRPGDTSPVGRDDSLVSRLVASASAAGGDSASGARGGGLLAVLGASLRGDESPTLNRLPPAAGGTGGRTHDIVSDDVMPAAASRHLSHQQQVQYDTQSRPSGGEGQHGGLHRPRDGSGESSREQFGGGALVGSLSGTAAEQQRQQHTQMTAAAAAVAATAAGRRTSSSCGRGETARSALLASGGASGHGEEIRAFLASAGASAQGEDLRALLASAGASGHGESHGGLRALDEGLRALLASSSASGQGESIRALLALAGASGRGEGHGGLRALDESLGGLLTTLATISGGGGGGGTPPPSWASPLPVAAAGEREEVFGNGGHIHHRKRRLRLEELAEQQQQQTSGSAPTSGQGVAEHRRGHGSLVNLLTDAQEQRHGQQQPAGQGQQQQQQEAPADLQAANQQRQRDYLNALGLRLKRKHQAIAAAGVSTQQQPGSGGSGGSAAPPPLGGTPSGEGAEGGLRQASSFAAAGFSSKIRAAFSQLPAVIGAGGLQPLDAGSAPDAVGRRKAASPPPSSPPEVNHFELLTNAPGSQYLELDAGFFPEPYASELGITETSRNPLAVALTEPMASAAGAGGSQKPALLPSFAASSSQALVAAITAAATTITSARCEDVVAASVGEGVAASREDAVAAIRQGVVSSAQRSPPSLAVPSGQPTAGPSSHKHRAGVETSPPQSRGKAITLARKLVGATPAAKRPPLGRVIRLSKLALRFGRWRKRQRLAAASTAAVASAQPSGSSSHPDDPGVGDDDGDDEEPKEAVSKHHVVEHRPATTAAAPPSAAAGRGGLNGESGGGGGGLRQVSGGGSIISALAAMQHHSQQLQLTEWAAAAASPQHGGDHSLAPAGAATPPTPPLTWHPQASLPGVVEGGGGLQQEGPIMMALGQRTSPLGAGRPPWVHPLAMLSPTATTTAWSPNDHQHGQTPPPPHLPSPLPTVSLPRGGVLPVLPLSKLQRSSKWDPQNLSATWRLQLSSSWLQQANAALGGGGSGPEQHRDEAAAKQESGGGRSTPYMGRWQQAGLSAGHGALSYGPMYPDVGPQQVKAEPDKEAWHAMQHDRGDAIADRASLPPPHHHHHQQQFSSSFGEVHGKSPGAHWTSINGGGDGGGGGGDDHLGSSRSLDRAEVTGGDGGHVRPAAYRHSLQVSDAHAGSFGPTDSLAAGAGGGIAATATVPPRDAVPLVDGAVRSVPTVPAGENPPAAASGSEIEAAAALLHLKR